MNELSFRHQAYDFYNHHIHIIMEALHRGLISHSEADFKTKQVYDAVRGMLGEIDNEWNYRPMRFFHEDDVVEEETQSQKDNKQLKKLTSLLEKM